MSVTTDHPFLGTNWMGGSATGPLGSSTAESLLTVISPVQLRPWPMNLSLIGTESFGPATSGSFPFDNGCREVDPALK
jgi:hypothetical protein